ncbi:MAG: amidohydrolase family protein [Planctomycetes bacterium]|nr:amidohydrolase family protein [Planctomycetota bacterium]
MIIDLNTFVWANVDQLGPEFAARWRERIARSGEQLDAHPAEHERAMGCVDGAVVRGFRADRLQARIPNELVAEFVGKDPGRRLGVAGIDPLSADAFDQLEAAVALGLVGANVSPVCSGFHPSHTVAMRLYERCVDLALPLFVSVLEPLTGRAVLEFARPAAWDEVARSFPDLRIVISQLGHPFVDEALILVGKHEHVYADISGVASRGWQLYNALLSAASYGVMEKLLFGSGFPADTPVRTIEALYRVNAFSQGTQLPSIPRSSITGIVERNSLACLGIEAEISPRRDESETEEPEVAVVDVVDRAPEPAVGRTDAAKGSWASGADPLRPLL